MDPRFVPFVIVGVVGFFLAMWFGVLSFLSLVGGWHFLARHFRAESQPEAKPHSMVDGMVGVVSYRGVLSVAVSPAGLYLSVFGLFRPGHPALYLPRAAISTRRTWTPLSGCTR